MLAHVTASLVDAANPTVFIAARAVGLTGREEPQTLTAIGKRLGFSAERASQLEQRALKRLAAFPELAALREAA